MVPSLLVPENVKGRRIAPRPFFTCTAGNEKAGGGFLSTLGFRSLIFFSYAVIRPLRRVDGRKKKPHQKKKAQKVKEAKLFMVVIVAD